MTTSAAERPAIASYNKPITREADRFEVVEVKWTTISIDEKGIRNTVSIDRSTLVQSAKIAEHKNCM